MRDKKEQGGNVDKILHQLKRRKRFDGHVLKVDAKLVRLEGTERPCFSLTGELRDIKHRGEPVSCGCIHETILAHFPELRILADIHLSDDDGVPMHALENAFYWYGGTKGQERDDWKLARHLRVTLARARAIVGGRDRFETEYIVNAQRPRWKREAETAIKLLKRG